MKLLVDSRKFRESLANAEERAKFDSYFAGGRNLDTMPLLSVTLPQSKTLTQLAAIWVDYTTVGALLHCDKSYVYYLCLRAESLSDIWLQQDEFGIWQFSTLSGLTKEQTSDAIPRLRDYMQELVNSSYGEWVPIEWAEKENVKTEEEVEDESH